MDKRKAITFMVLFSFFSWVVGIIGVYYILDFYDFSESVLKVTFIGLAALTVPHMILVDGFFRPKFKI
jgi:ABC-type maltose transport system permease subunit